MNQFLKKVLTLFVSLYTISALAQNVMSDKGQLMPFQPKFSFGTAYHSFQGDIQGPVTNTLLGNIGYRAGMRLNILANTDISVLFSNTSFYEKNSLNSFRSNMDAIGLHLGYTFNSLIKRSRISPFLSAGLQSLSFKTFTNRNWSDRELAIGLPVGLGLKLEISERIDLDASFNYTVASADIDKSDIGSADNFLSAIFTLHYDLFTSRPKEVPFDDSYYSDVNFKALDLEDEDGDLIADINDYCHNTPIGVEVDKNGCPLDGDNDGIPDYVDKEKDSRKGSIVDENGVVLSSEQYHSMYSDYDAASREYANFYNENEIKREDYKTIDEYLIAKANAFNKAYNEDKEFSNKVNALQYKVKIGSYSDGIPARVINKYLSLDDLESISQEDGSVIYVVGSYSTYDEAKGREYSLEDKKFNETSVIVYNNGRVTDYSPPTPDLSIDNKQVDTAITKEVEIEVKQNKKLPIKKSNLVRKNIVSNNETIYRVEIGTFKDELSDVVFSGIENVVPVKGKDGWITYTVGAFVEYRDAVNSLNQMRARGFEDAFILTYKDGERISLNVAIKNENNDSQNETIDEEEVKPNLIFSLNVLELKKNVEYIVETAVLKDNIQFSVQVAVTKESLSSEDLNKMSKLGSIEKEVEGSELYRYFTGNFFDIESAKLRLEEVRQVGYPNAFVLAKLDGNRIPVDQTTEPKNLGNFSNVEEANNRVSKAREEGDLNALVYIEIDGERSSSDEVYTERALGEFSTYEEFELFRSEYVKLNTVNGTKPSLSIAVTLDGKVISLEKAKELSDI